MYKTEVYRNLIFNISEKAPLNAILKYLNLVNSGIPAEKQENIIYSTMELVNNSLRAQRETGSHEKPVKLRFSAEDDYLLIVVKDCGGGFETSLLPYDMNTPARDVDLESTAFQRYRERYSYNRFGMGLLTARQMADLFTLEFHRKGKVMNGYQKGRTEGTIVTMGIKWYA